MARTEPSAEQTKIGDAVTLDRAMSSRTVDGLDLVMRVDGDAVFPRGEAVHLSLSVTNRTGRPVGYLTNHETHFALVDQSNKTLWNDDACGAGGGSGTSSAPSYRALAPGDHLDLAAVYPGGDSCAAPAGHDYLIGGLTVCLNLQADGTCRGASDERVNAMPVAVTIS